MVLSIIKLAKTYKILCIVRYHNSVFEVSSVGSLGLFLFAWMVLAFSGKGLFGSM